MNSIVTSYDNKNVNIYETIDAIASAGFKTVFIQWYDKDLEIDQLEQLKYARQKGLEIEFAHLGYQNINSIWLDNDEFDIERYYKDLDDLNSLGIKMVCMHITSKFVAPGPNEIGIKRIQSILKHAKSLGMKIALENIKIKEHLEYVLDHIKDEDLGICYDAGHDNCFLNNSYDIERFANRIFLVHLHDNRGQKDEHLLPFDGNIVWKDIIARLKKAGYKGNITLESVYSAYYVEKTGVKEYYIRALEAAKRLEKMLDEA